MSWLGWGVLLALWLWLHVRQARAQRELDALVESFAMSLKGHGIVARAVEALLDDKIAQIDAIGEALDHLPQADDL